MLYFVVGKYSIISKSFKTVVLMHFGVKNKPLCLEFGHSLFLTPGEDDMILFI